MSLSVYLSAIRETNVYSAKITHNLGKMAKQVKVGKYSLYDYLWHPDALGLKVAGELILPLAVGLDILRKKPAKYKKLNSPNGWGIYEHFVLFVEKYLLACTDNPDAKIEVSR